MAAVDRVDIISLPSTISRETIKGIMNRTIWAWYNEHKEEVIIERKVWFFKITLKIKDLRFLIVRIAGPEEGL